MREFLFSPFVIPLSAFVMVVCIVAITQYHKLREKELQSDHELRLKEMAHKERMKTLEIELARAKGGEKTEG